MYVMGVAPGLLYNYKGSHLLNKGECSLDLLQQLRCLTQAYLNPRRRVDTANGSPTSDSQLSHRDMFGYLRHGSETRPSVYSGVTPPENPTPSTSTDSEVGYMNGALQDVHLYIR